MEKSSIAIPSSAPLALKSFQRIQIVAPLAKVSPVITSEIDAEWITLPEAVDP